MKRSCVMSGDLEAMSLADIVQNLTLGARTGHVVVEAGSRRGVLWLRDGALVHAEAGVLSGETAVFEMLSWKEGQFVIEYDVVSDARSIEQESTYLVLEGLRRVDERRAERSSSKAREPSSLRSLKAIATVRSGDRIRRLGTALLVAAVVGVLVTFATSGLLPWTVPDTAAKPDELTGRSMREIRPDAPTHREAAPRQPADDVEPAADPPPASDDADDAAEPFEEPAAASAEETEIADTLPGIVIGPLVPLYLSPGSVVEENPAVAQAPPPPAAEGHLRIEGKCKIEDGAIEVFLGDDKIWSHDSGPDDKFDARVRVPAGRHEIVTRVDLGRESAVYESRLDAEIREGVERTLKIVAGKRFGSPVSVKLD